MLGERLDLLLEQRLLHHLPRSSRDAHRSMEVCPGMLTNGSLWTDGLVVLALGSECNL